MSGFEGPLEFAKEVAAAQGFTSEAGPSRPFLESMAMSMYLASMETEENRPVACSVIYLDPHHPDPDPPDRKTAVYWRAVPFRHAVPVSVHELSKLALASDPRTSILAIHEDADGIPYVWGLVDQAASYARFVDYEQNWGPAWPNALMLTIEGPGFLEASVGYRRIARLRSGQMQRTGIDPFLEGPVREALSVGTDRFVDAVQVRTGDRFGERDHWPGSLSASWFSVVRRLVGRMQRLGHGGALLFTPGQAEYLDVKHEVRYPRLQETLIEDAIATIARVSAEDEIHEAFLDTDSDSIPTDLYLDEVVSRNEEREREHELNNGLWFIATTSRIDGLVLLDMDLILHGFGVMVTTEEPPTSIAEALDVSGKLVRPLSYSAYGSRHRSLMRYCSAVPGSVGVVVSQDGSVRVMLHNRDQLLVWASVDFRRQQTAAWDDD